MWSIPNMPGKGATSNEEGSHGHAQASCGARGAGSVEALKQEGVEKIFCLPGSHILQVYDALRQEPSIRLITCKQEPNASLMADAYGRLTGQPGVCLLTAGPGAANSLAGVAQAYGAASPVVHITGAVPLNADREAFHGVDDPEFVVKMYQNVTKLSLRIQKILFVTDSVDRRNRC